jgi:hypothetical protein
MRISILDDYHDTLRTLPCFQKLAGHRVTVWNDRARDVETLAERLRDTEILVLIRERTKIGAPLLERLDKLSDRLAGAARSSIVRNRPMPGRPRPHFLRLHLGTMRDAALNVAAALGHAVILT